MADARNCPKCGARLAADAPNAPCPACLMKLGLQSWENQQSVDATIDSPASPGSSTSFVPPPPDELADRFPQFEILNLLGHGGMGAVYKARQKSLDRLVALKIIKPDAAENAGFAERFAREAKSLAKLSHSNIVGVFDFGQSDGLYYFAMEYVDGVNLRQLIETHKLSPEHALQIIPQICEALQFAHDEGIVHRDIKPENILVEVRPKKGADPDCAQHLVGRLGNRGLPPFFSVRVKIADFGLAKLLSDAGVDHGLTGTHQVMGTPRYMAPEQMEGARAVDHRADIYSLGVVFYEMLTGELPLGRFDPPSHKAAIGQQWDEVVLRALEKEPDKRYQNASDVKSEIERISDHDRPPVRPAALADGKDETSEPNIGTIPHYGMLMMGGVMASLGLLLLFMSAAEGTSVFTWIGIGIALGGGGCFSGAFHEDTRLPAGTRANVGMLMQGGVMVGIGLGVLLYCFAHKHGFWVGNPFLWVGLGLAMGGGGCFMGAWHGEYEDETLADPIEASPAKPPLKPAADEFPKNELVDSPTVTANLVIAWISSAVAVAFFSILSVHAANPILSWVLWSAWGVVTPTVMCGLVVWRGQRSRGIRYPVYPGEWMWNAHAIAAWIWFVFQIPVFGLQVLERGGIIQIGQAIPTVSFSSFIVVGAIHAFLALILTFMIREARWKFYALTFAFGLMARVVAHAFVIASLWSESFRSTGLAPSVLALSVLPVVPLIVIVIVDVLEGKRYPWSHWVGVALQGCFHLLMLVYVIVQFTATLA